MRVAVGGTASLIELTSLGSLVLDLVCGLGAVCLRSAQLSQLHQVRR